jgi:hypothetical protein
MITARLHSYTWAEDLHQWIPFHTRNVELELLGTGNYKVVKMEGTYTRKGEMVEMRHPFGIFNSMGYLISDTPSWKAVQAGAMRRWPKITNITVTQGVVHN